MTGLVLGGVVCATTTCGAWTLYNTGKEALQAHTRKELLGFSKLVSKFVDGDNHGSFRSPDQETSAAYEKAITPLRRVLEANPDIKFAYTMVLDGNAVRFVLDPTPEGDADGDGVEDKSHIYEEYDSASPAMLQALREHRAVTEPSPSKDKWGTFISGYAPLFTKDNRFAGVVGVDLDAKTYMGRLTDLRHSLYLCLLMALGFGLTSGLTCGAMRLRQGQSKEAHRRASIVEAQRSVLELVVVQAPLGKLLAAVCREIERLVPGVWCSIWVQREEGLTYRAVTQVASADATPMSGVYAEYGCPVMGSDGQTLGRVMLKVPSERIRPAEAQELCAVAASLASIAIEKRTAEEALMKAHDALEQTRLDLETKVKERTAELERATQAKSDFLAEMSHEARTPLGGVIGISDLLLETDLDAEQQEYATIIRDSAHHMLDLMDGLLDLAQIESGTVTLEVEPMHFGDELRTLVKPLRHAAADKGVEFRLDVADGLDQVVLGCPLRLRQIVTNLIGNALKFTEQGYVSVDAEVVENADGKWAEVRVSDTGPGIPLELQESVLRRFVQASHRHGGAGLGLAISKELVELMGGSISFSSVPGEGTTFYVRLPYSMKHLAVA